MGYALSAQQTFAQKDLPDLTRMEQYLYHLDTMRCELPPSVKYLAVDGAYAKENFVTGTVHLQLHVISKLRCDANLRPSIHGRAETARQTAQVRRLFSS